MKCILLNVFDHFQGNALYLNFARLQLTALLGIALVLCKQPGAPIFALHKAFERRALISEHSNHLPVISLLSAFNEDEIAVTYSVYACCLWLLAYWFRCL